MHFYRVSDVRVVIQRKIYVFGKCKDYRCSEDTSEKEINLSLLV